MIMNIFLSIIIPFEDFFLVDKEQNIWTDHPASILDC